MDTLTCKMVLPSSSTSCGDALPSWYRRNNFCLLKDSTACISAAVLVSQNRIFKTSNAAELDGTVGMKAKIGLIERPPDPRVMEIAASIAPLISGPLYETLIPACFTSVSSSKSGHFRRCFNVFVNVATFHRGEIMPLPSLYGLESHNDAYWLKARHVQRWGDQKCIFVCCVRNRSSS